MAAACRAAESRPHRPADGRCLVGATDRRLPGIDRRDGRSHRLRRAIRARGVLHRGARRDDPGLLRRDGEGRRPRGDGAPAGRLHRLAQDPEVGGDLRGARPGRRDVGMDAAGSPAQGRVPAPRSAQPPQTRRRRRPRRLRRLAESHLPRLQLREEHQTRPHVAGAGVPRRRTGRRPGRCGVPVGLAHRDRRGSVRGRTRTGHRGSRTSTRRSALPDGAERAGIRHREQPADVPLAHPRRDREGHPDEPVLRARRGDDLCHHHGMPARTRRAAVRIGARRPGDGLSRTAVVLRDAAASRSAHLPLPPRTSCTPSTSRSTTTSP